MKTTDYINKMSVLTPYQAMAVRAEREKLKKLKEKEDKVDAERDSDKGRDDS